jgi:hypothetical protein
MTVNNPAWLSVPKQQWTDVESAGVAVWCTGAGGTVSIIGNECVLSSRSAWRVRAVTVANSETITDHGTQQQ